ncbi:MAG: hypothetical protein WAM82_21695 [Thermoanaerobaculia bacterium]
MRGELEKERDRADRLEAKLGELSGKTDAKSDNQMGSAPVAAEAAGTNHLPPIQAETGINGSSGLKPSGAGGRSGPPQPQSELDAKLVKPVATGPPVIVKDPFRFTLKRCSYIEREQRVRCELVVENISEKTEPLLFNPMYYMGGRVSILATDDGKHYHARIERGAVENALNPAPDYVPGVPTEVALVFDGITAELGRTTLVVEADKGLFGQRYTLRFPPIVVGNESASNPSP